MQSYRSERLKLGIAAAAALLLWSGTGIAQDASQKAPPPSIGAPIRLIPPPPPDQMFPGTEASANTGAGNGPLVEATPLAPVDSSWIGAIDEADHPLPQNMWEHTPRALVAAALPLLGVTDSPVLQSLSRRLLLSAAAAPAGSDPANGPVLAFLRIDRLAALGAIKGASALIDGVSAKARDEKLERLRVALAFAANDVPNACLRAADAITRYQGVEWDRAQIACQALSGDQAKAGLGLDLLHEQNAQPDANFDALIAAAGGGAKPDKLTDPSPLRAALWAATKRPLPDETIAAADPMTLLAWVNNSALPAADRLAAAERAALLGALPVERLAELYSKVDFREDERAKALGDEKLGDHPRGRALLYVVAHDAAAANIRVQAAHILLNAARRNGLYFVTAKLLAPVIIALTPSDQTAKVAPVFVRALIASGSSSAIAPWVANADLVELRPLLTLLNATKAGDGGMPDLKALHQALADLQQRGGENGARQAALFETLLSAYVAAISAEDLIPLLAPSHAGELPSAGLWLDQQQASNAKETGETILTSIILAQTKNHLTPEPILLRRAISGLRAIGMEGEAQALTLEAAIGGGI